MTLEAKGVTKRYGDLVALDDVRLRVAPGERVALVRESGSGKTTLLRSFNRMVEPDAGLVFVGRADVGTMDPVSVRRSPMILSGAVPAAVLALLVDGALAGVERLVRPRGLV
jgi:ABC-type proline/glycine betaine transport system ATPase subunit